MEIKTTSAQDSDYFERQFREPYRSTVRFCEFLEARPYWRDVSSVVDVGCGLGANTHFIAERFPEKRVIGFDVSSGLITKGNRILRRIKSRAKLVPLDLFRFRRSELHAFGKIDMVISLQTLSWFPDLNKALQRMLLFRPTFQAHSSLYYEGPVSCQIKVFDHSAVGGDDGDGSQFEHGEQFNYNVYSIDQMALFLGKRNQKIEALQEFVIDRDLKRPHHKRMGTYTVLSKKNKRIQISGPLLMPWYFVSITSNK